MRIFRRSKARPIALAVLVSAVDVYIRCRWSRKGHTFAAVSRKLAHIGITFVRNSNSSARRIALLSCAKRILCLDSSEATQKMLRLRLLAQIRVLFSLYPEQ